MQIRSAQPSLIWLALGAGESMSRPFSKPALELNPCACWEDLVNLLAHIPRDSYGHQARFGIRSSDPN